MAMNQMDEFGGSEGGDPADVDAYLVGATSIVWEDELYTYGVAGYRLNSVANSLTRKHLFHFNP